MDTEMNSLQTIDGVADTTDLPVAEVNDQAKNGLSTMGKVGIGAGVVLGVVGIGFGVWKLVKHIKAKKQNTTEVVEEQK